MSQLLRIRSVKVTAVKKSEMRFKEQEKEKKRGGNKHELKKRMKHFHSKNRKSMSTSRTPGPFIMVFSIKQQTERDCNHEHRGSR